MEQTTQGTDWRQFRKSTHLASADVEILQQKGHNLIFTIGKAQHEYGTNVNGTKTDGVFIYFTEQGVKPFKVNSKNSTIISGFAIANGIGREYANMVENWQGISIELYVDTNVKFGRDIVSGVRIRPVQPKQKEKPLFTQEMFENAKQANATVQSISEHYVITEEIAKMYNEFLKVK